MEIYHHQILILQVTSTPQEVILIQERLVAAMVYLVKQVRLKIQPLLALNNILKVRVKKIKTNSSKLRKLQIIISTLGLDLRGRHRMEGELV